MGKYYVMSLALLFSGLLSASWASEIEEEGVALDKLDIPAHILFEEDVHFAPLDPHKVFYQNGDKTNYKLYCVVYLKEAKQRKRVIPAKSKFEILSVSWDGRSQTTITIQSEQIKNIVCAQRLEKKIFSTTDFIEAFGKTAVILQNTAPPETIK